MEKKNDHWEFIFACIANQGSYYGEKPVLMDSSATNELPTWLN
jgi:hypothetical protein